jgi:hypothetical protein
MAVEELIDVAGRVTIEAVLNLSAQQVVGVPSQGKRREGEIYWQARTPATADPHEGPERRIGGGIPTLVSAISLPGEGRSLTPDFVLLPY